VTGLRPVRRLAANDKIDRFECGVPALNEWLQRFSLSDQAAGASVTYVLEREQRIVGFYTLAPHAIAADRASTAPAAWQRI